MSVVNTTLKSWHSPLFSSPQHKGSLLNYTSSLWSTKPSEPASPWASAQLQPSTNIWGPQVESPAKVQLSAFSNPCASLGGSLNLSGLANVNTSRRPAPTATATLAGAIKPSISACADPYLVSPPPSPPMTESVSAGTTTSAVDAAESTIISSTCGPLYLVKFKGNRVNVFTAPGTAVYHTGDVVMVDADRGRDLGTIVAANVSRRDAAALKQRHHSDRHIALRASSPSSSPTLASPGSPVVYTPKQILSQATASEISDMEAKVADEAAAISLCTKKAVERNLDMCIVDAEYQWDRRKLTFFYVANSRVDFRDLVRELFRIYKTRIWMCATSARS